MVHFRIYGNGLMKRMQDAEELTISLELDQLHISPGCEHILKDRPGFRILQLANIRFRHFFQVLDHRGTACVDTDEEVRAGVHDEMGEEGDPI
jgi:hypothetical protein